MKEITLEQRVKGALYAFAIGDAMGATTEFMKKNDIVAKYGSKGLRRIAGGGWLNLKPGQVTDDTQMMLCVADAMKLVKHDDEFVDHEELTGFLDKCAKNFVKWFKTNPPDVGGQCARVIYEFAHSDPYSGWNVAWRNSQLNGNSAQGNGGLMRALPAAMLKDGRACALQSCLTHNSSEALNCIFCYHRMVQMALQGADKSSFAGAYERIRWSALCHVQPTGHVSNTLANAVYWFCNTDSVEDCIVRCVNDGGDADTIAAIAGGIAGAFYGYDNIPARHVKALNKGVRRDLDKAVETVVNLIGK